MLLPEVKNGNLFRLVPEQRRHLTLKLLEANVDGLSKNALYCRTSPACIRKGYTRSIGTYNDTNLVALVTAKLIKVEYKYRGKQPPAWSSDMPLSEFNEWHLARHRKISSYTITGKGELVLMALNNDKMITFYSDGDIKSATGPGE